jgi:hypothetical protein
MEILYVYFMYACTLYLPAYRQQEELEPNMRISRNHILVPCFDVLSDEICGCISLIFSTLLLINSSSASA